MDYIKGYSDKKFGLLGEHLSHSFSPQIHKELADYPYALYEVEKGNLGEWVKTNDLAGYNVTIPYKQDVMQYLNELSPCAKSIGAVNTVVRRSDGTLLGDNTNYYGFAYMLSKLGVDIKGKKALILGGGGASKTVQAVLKEQGADIVVVDLGLENNYDNIHLHFDAEIIVNATPVGMYPKTGMSLVNLEDFGKCCGVCDVIYNPANTALLLQAQKLGIPSVNGLSMLVAQAKRAAEIFTDTCLSDDVIEKIRADVEAQTVNVVLVGMPGCGKSTVGRLVAEALGRELVDSDEEIKRVAGVTPSEIIKSKGEAEFRKIESQVLSDICKQSSLVIATGGGAVTIPDNKDILRQNGVVVFIDRDLRVLATDDRPLSVNLPALYEKRLPMYKDFAHTMVDGNTDAKTVADRILATFREALR